MRIRKDVSSMALLVTAFIALAQAGCGGGDKNGEDAGVAVDVADETNDDAAEIIPGDTPVGDAVPGDVFDAGDGEIADVGEVQGHWVQLYSPLSGDHVLKSV